MLSLIMRHDELEDTWDPVWSVLILKMGEVRLQALDNPTEAGPPHHV